MNERGIEFTGLRYSYGDAFLKSYDPAIAEIQWEYSSFGNILSDEEARTILNCINNSTVPELNGSCEISSK